MVRELVLGAARTRLEVVEAYTYWGEIAAERIAVGLPPAPRCPL
jgi:hypothetical protein